MTTGSFGMNPASYINVEAILASLNVMVKNSHVVYSKGQHGRDYFNKRTIYIDVYATMQLCMVMAYQIATDKRIDAVLAPEAGGVALSQWVAYHLSQRLGYRVDALTAAKDGNDGFVLNAEMASRTRDRSVWILEDVINTGKSAQQVIDLARHHNGDVLGLSVICNRGGLNANDFEVPILTQLVGIELEKWEASDCPLCADIKNHPINTQVGHGAKFLAEQAKS